ncbi:MAG: gamma-glutamyltransferase [Gammaproteobacteria bacterium]|nr:gamma-glutamyltransferase [Gammaproteobacteria bacterium]
MKTRNYPSNRNVKNHSVCGILLFTLSIIQFSLLQAEGGRTPVYARHGMVSSASRLASEVGVEVLGNGGNAVDAAVATAFALAVTWPTAGNIGGGGFLVYHSDTGEFTSFDFRERAPLAATERMYLGLDGQIVDDSNHSGPLAVGVPGTVAGLWLTHQRLGSLPWSELVEPAIKLAREGIPITYALQTGFVRNADRFRQYPASARKFLRSDGSFFMLGDTWFQPMLAHTLELIRDNGADGFYRGENAQRFVHYMASIGGLITEEDLDRYEAIEREPILGSYREYDIISMPPPSSGGVALVQMLNILEGYDLAALGHNSADYLHVLTEAMRRAYADRAQHLGDPDFNEAMPLERLLSKDYAAQLRAGIDMAQKSESSSQQIGQPYESEETTHFSVVDGEGNIVSMTYTLEYGYGSAIVVEGGGYLLNNELGDFNAVPGLTDEEGSIGTAPNLIAPGKRPLSSMTPTIVAQDGRPIFAAGSPGGRTIINTTLQIILNIIDHGFNIAEAIEAGRIHHQWLPDLTNVETLGFSQDTLNLYKSKGHAISQQGSQGAAMGVYYDRDSGYFLGASDSRRGDAAAVGY